MSEEVRGRIREAIGPMSVNALAKRLRYPQSSVDGWLRSREPSFKFLYDLAREFGVSLDWLTDGKGPKYPAGEAAGAPRTEEEKARYKTKKDPSGEAQISSAIERGGGELSDLLWALVDLKLENPDGFNAVRSTVEALLKKGEGEK